MADGAGVCVPGVFGEVEGGGEGGGGVSGEWRVDYLELILYSGFLQACCHGVGLADIHNLVGCAVDDEPWGVSGVGRGIPSGFVGTFLFRGSLVALELRQDRWCSEPIADPCERFKRKPSLSVSHLVKRSETAVGWDWGGGVIFVNELAALFLVESVEAGGAVAVTDSTLLAAQISDLPMLGMCR